MKTKSFIFSIFIFIFTNFTALAQDNTKPIIKWEQLKNPVYQHADWSVKDPCMIYDDGWIYLFFSAFFYDAGLDRSHIVCVRTQDFVNYSEPLFIWSGMPEGWIGLCSPDIKKIDDRFILTYNSWGDKEGAPNKLFYATSKNLKKWKTGLPLAEKTTAGVRAIDASIALFNDKYYLVYKRVQDSQLAVADSLNSESWTVIGRPVKEWSENSQIIRIENKWYILVTMKDNNPVLAEMKGNGKKDEDWIVWENYKNIAIPLQRFNTDDRANAAFLADWREIDGYYYLIYAGRSEDISHNGRGDNKIGIARSKDLLKWESPPDN